MSTQHTEQSERAKAVLAALDALGDDAAVHIYPDDLEKCNRSECAVTAYSVRVGDISGARSVPLFSREQVAAALLSEDKACQCRVGHLTISRHPEVGIWLQHDNGEGMQTDEDKLYQYLSAYWNKEF